ncbi:putative Histidine kinase [Georgfuchsia toluolica]|uniref:histidine kinase n=1 Tax=Georgfuchsia toluolica TaxID=424218 RepID=A0A916N382_9PROT|nr:CHASE2 domain-containing protein [Georgfuchsia toluolica]CAG4884709.1 putative Histidine kinase [Georgfuchsia toluolica]
MQAPEGALASRRKKHSLAYEWGIVTGVVTIISFLLVAGSWTWNLDQVIYDAGIFLLKRPAREDVIIVSIDDESIATVGPWPWPGATIASLLDHMSAARPKAVGIDMVFAGPDTLSRRDNKLLAEALRKTPNAMLPVFKVQGQEVKPAVDFARNAQLVSTNPQIYPDEVLHNVSLVSQETGNPRPHMAFAMAKVAGIAAPPGDANEYLISYVGPPGTIKHVSAAAVLQGNVPPNLLAGKFILLGFTASRLANWHLTPSVIGSEKMAGVEVTANILCSLLDRKYIRQPDILFVGLVTATAMLLLLIAFYRASQWLSLCLMFATAVFAPVLALVLLYRFGLWFPPMSVTVSALFAYPYWNWKRLETICNYLDEEIVRLEHDQHKVPPVRAVGLISFADYIQNRVELIHVNINYLRAARKFLSESLDGLPFAALVVTPDGKLVTANQRALELCQLDKMDLSRHRIDHALAHHVELDGSDWLTAVLSALKGDELDLKAGDSKGSEFEVALAPFRNDEGVVSGLIIVIEDVTALRLAQREREDALSFLSHDIRAPQNSIMALAELQRDSGMRKPEAEFVADVEALARKTVMLAEDFLYLAMADSKTLNLDKYDLQSLVDDCVAEIQPQARAKQISIEISEADDRAVVMADRSLLVRAIGNLLVNAVKYSPQGGVIIMKCEISVMDAICSISDNGPGIHEDDLPKLFRRFSRAQSRDSRISGSGLGLVFVDVVARRHRGRTLVKSIPERGATFSIVLPRIDPLDAE